MTTKELTSKLAKDFLLEGMGVICYCQVDGKPKSTHFPATADQYATFDRDAVIAIRGATSVVWSVC